MVHARHMYVHVHVPMPMSMFTMISSTAVFAGLLWNMGGTLLFKLVYSWFVRVCPVLG